MAPASPRHSATPNGIEITPTAKPALSCAKERLKAGIGSKIQSPKVRRPSSLQPANSIATSPLNPSAHGVSSMASTNCSDTPEKPPPIFGTPMAALNGSIAALLLPFDDFGFVLQSWASQRSNK